MDLVDARGSASWAPLGSTRQKTRVWLQPLSAAAGKKDARERTWGVWTCRRVERDAEVGRAGTHLRREAPQGRA